MSNVLDTLINRLTDNYNKNTSSNVYKLMQVATKHIQENEDILTLIQNWRDIDQAQGTTLDQIGKNVQQNRGQASDAMYRVLIKSKIRRNMSDGSIDTLIDFIAFLLNVSKTSVKVQELWSQGKHATIHVEAPTDAVNSTGLSLTQFSILINEVVAAGVRAEVFLEGTFSFSATYDASETSNPQGFADDLGTTGGTLGYVYDPVNDIELPI